MHKIRLFFAAVLASTALLLVPTAAGASQWSNGTVNPSDAVQGCISAAGCAPTGLQAVSCVSPTNCSALGGILDSWSTPGRPHLDPAFEQFDGTSWTLVPTPLATGDAVFADNTTTKTSLRQGVTYSTLSIHALSRPLPAGAALAIGTTQEGSSSWTLVTLRTAAAQGAKTLSITPFTSPRAYAAGVRISYAAQVGMVSPNLTNGVNFGPGDVQFPDASMSCVPSLCVATISSYQTPAPSSGYSTQSYVDVSTIGTPVYSAAIKGTFLYVNKGAGWSTAPSFIPNVRLTSLTCSSTTFCMAVGSNMTATSPLAVQYDGSTWTSVSTSSVTPGSTLFSTSCPTISTCFALTAIPNGGPTGIATYASGKWSEVAQTATSSPPALVTSLSCSTPQSCIAAGTSFSPSGKWRTFSLTGTTWTSKNAPDGMTPLAVSCAPGVNACATVGIVFPGLPGGDTLDSGTWSRFTGITGINYVPSGTAAQPAFDAVSCPTSTWCMAVGSLGNDGGWGSIYATGAP